MQYVHTGKNTSYLKGAQTGTAKEIPDLPAWCIWFLCQRRGENSDIDIAVEITGPMGLSFIAMANEIEDILGTKVDVVPKRAIKPHYLPYVEKDIVYV